MSRALKSAFYRFFSTGLFAKTLIFSVLAGFILAFYYNSQINYSDPFSRPRLLDGSFVCGSLVLLFFVVPVFMAIFCVSFTGSDIAFRAINNKISTGISRTQIYLSDLIVSITASTMVCLLSEIGIFLWTYLWARRVSVRFNSTLIGLIIAPFIVSAAFTAIYVCTEFFASSKVLALILSLLIMPCFSIATTLMSTDLEEPYKFQYVNEETNEIGWNLNPKYVGGTKREIYTLVLNSSVYSGEVFENGEFKLTAPAIASGVVVVAFTAAGVASVRKKEFL